MTGSSRLNVWLLEVDATPHSEGSRRFPQSGPRVARSDPEPTKDPLT